MVKSLLCVSPDSFIYIFAFDNESYKILTAENIEFTEVISLKDFETDELKRIKGLRTKAEYCWTCTPSTIAYVLDKYNLPSCTYLDADLYFYSDPVALLEEMYANNKSVLITEHRFSLLARIYEEKRAGRFCVQFVTFINNPESKAVLNRWKQQCIDWCYARYEDGKFGDQKYLEEWPSRYSNIHILQHPGGGLAPWNITKYRFIRSGNRLNGDERKGGTTFLPVFYHFQYVKQIESRVFDTGWYLLPTVIKKIFYKPYLDEIIKIEEEIYTRHNFRAAFSLTRNNSIKDLIKNVLKNIFHYNIIKVS
jgi:hypothetical protein